jgi:ABC-type polysaccharide/polyol phosphate transport system ATPase subunit
MTASSASSATDSAHNQPQDPRQEPFQEPQPAPSLAPDPARTPLIEAVGISKRFRLQREHQRSLQESFIRLLRGRRDEAEYFWPLRDFTLRVYPGETIGILGQNGSGKSTLLKLLTGVLQPTNGEIYVNARVASLLELGAGFHPDLTGRENIFLNASIYGMDNRTIRRNLDSIIDFAEIGDFIDTPVKHYSSGMYVRLGFAVAIHTQPDVMIVDEVLTVGDQIFQQKCMQSISEMEKAGVALILVSHNVEDIRRLCSRAIWLHNGYVRADGNSFDVVDAYVAHANEQFYARRMQDKVTAQAKDGSQDRDGGATDSDERDATGQSKTGKNKAEKTATNEIGRAHV